MTKTIRLSFALVVLTTLLLSFVSAVTQILPVVPQVEFPPAPGAPNITSITFVPLGSEGAVLATVNATGAQPLGFAWFFLRSTDGGLLPPILASQRQFDNSQLFTPDSFLNTPKNPAVVWVVVVNKVGVAQSLALPFSQIIGVNQTTIIGGGAGAGAGSGSGSGS